MVSSASLTNYDHKLSTTATSATGGGGATSTISASNGGGGGFYGGGGGKQASSVIVSNSSMSFPYQPVTSSSSSQAATTATLPFNRSSFNSNKSGSVRIYLKYSFRIRTLICKFFFQKNSNKIRFRRSNRCPARVATSTRWCSARAVISIFALFSATFVRRAPKALKKKYLSINQGYLYVFLYALLLCRQIVCYLKFIFNTHIICIFVIVANNFKSVAKIAKISSTNFKVEPFYLIISCWGCR